MAFFTKSSAATLPVTVASAENNMKAKKEVARFVLPICCTINMNGCAAFILVTSLFVMQNSGMPITIESILLWILIAAGIGCGGFMEYYVQRRGNEAAFAYSVMSGCLILVILLTLLIRYLAEKKKENMEAFVG